MIVKFLVVLGLVVFSVPVWSQPHLPLNQQLKQAIAADLDGPAYRTQARSDRIRSLLQDDERAVKQVLVEAMVPDAEGWISCKEGQEALREGMGVTQTVVGIEVLIRAAFALQVQCQGSTDLQLLEQGFGESLSGALRASAAALPGGLSNTYSLTSKLTPREIVSGVLGVSSQSEELQCSASTLYRERRQGLDYSNAEVVALKECQKVLTSPTA